MTAAMSGRASWASSVSGDGKAIEAELRAKVIDLESKIGKLSLGPFKIVVGGLGTDWSEDDAAKWLRDHLSFDGGPVPNSIYAKGLFTGLLYAEFASGADQDRAISKIRTARITWNGATIWAKPDLPLEQRLPESFAFSVKRVMVEWGWSRSALYVDREETTLYLGSEKVMSSKVSGYTLELSFGDGWQQELRDPKLDDLFNAAQEKLTKKSRVKGQGKGSEKGKGNSQARS